ncbi:PREDICTED: uncharacterized protein LOC108566487 [Nicrophorus vespilloides]|uniref:Regulatory protein zeste n=1 Tax=Nicrophorus vespilloides TaxID=110193 RepID=A0ABM1N4Y0_NICVS|nr:PREDICTED: uncharacterized protein LOC108566487 [Nicrophorus vespilloides]XP_017781879.1 PREDICTED: uncharacterized protein LOC108566487 [Nicrophorus vespilloides]XP_017781880.1 PREDICTED: uncharacterized protein LOC108566487 [Nicrophorus vespilloides]
MTMEQENKVLKRKRSENFSTAEKKLLIDLVMKHKHIVENKNSDAVTWQEKKNAWIFITDVFNSGSGKYDKPRTPDAIRGKYESLKKELRRKSYRANGEIIEYSEYEEKLLSIMGVLPLIVKCDQDQDYLVEDNIKIETDIPEDMETITDGPDYKKHKEKESYIVLESLIKAEERKQQEFEMDLRLKEQQYEKVKQEMQAFQELHTLEVQGKKLNIRLLEIEIEKKQCK